MSRLPQDLEHRVLAESWRDPDFGRRLQEDPHAALAALGLELPAGVVVNVVPTDSRTLTLPVAEHPSGPGETRGAGELSAQSGLTTEDPNCDLGRCSMTEDCFCAPTLTSMCECPL
jgi:hypothetical protein